MLICNLVALLPAEWGNVIMLGIRKDHSLARFLGCIGMTILTLIVILVSCSVLGNLIGV